MELADLLKTELESREERFRQNLVARGRLDLVSEFDVIKALRKVACILSPNGKVGTGIPESSLPAEFVWTDAVRGVIKTLPSDRFRTRDVYNGLVRRYPGITKSHRQTVSATVCNLAKNGELEREGWGPRVLYRIVKLWEKQVENQNTYDETY